VELLASCPIVAEDGKIGGIVIRPVVVSVMKDNVLAVHVTEAAGMVVATITVTATRSGIAGRRFGFLSMG
jgi:hypothetical protein